MMLCSSGFGTTSRSGTTVWVPADYRELAADPAVEGVVNHKRVARLMRENTLVGVHLRKSKITTVKDPDAQVFADLVGRDFTASELGTTYVGDVTYLPYGTEKCSLATVIDLCSRRIVGWSMADHMRTSLVEALQSAANNKKHSKMRFFIQIMVGNTRPRRSRRRAVGSGWFSRWAGSGRVLIMRWRSRSMLR